jgi:hypothetical protein
MHYIWKVKFGPLEKPTHIVTLDIEAEDKVEALWKVQQALYQDRGEGKLTPVEYNWCLSWITSIKPKVVKQ